MTSHLEVAENYIRELQEKSGLWEEERNECIDINNSDRQTISEGNNVIHLTHERVEAHTIEQEESLDKK